MQKRARLFAAVLVVLMTHAMVTVRAALIGKMTKPKTSSAESMGLSCDQYRGFMKAACSYFCGPHRSGNVTVTRYKEGQVIKVKQSIRSKYPYKLRVYTIDFRLCPIDDSRAITRGCLDDNPLKILDDNGNLTDYYFIKKDPRTAYELSLTLRVQLPQNLTCENCVLQWKLHYNWYKCIELYNSGCAGWTLPDVRCAKIAIDPA